MGAPLTVGYGLGENYLGSDALAVAPWTQRIAYLEEGDWAAVRRDRIDIFDRENRPVARAIVESGASSAPVEKGNYAHYMQKEIFEQPIVVAQTLQSYVRPFEGEVALPVADADLESIERLTIFSCGSSFYA
jgi:glucosamine--fructose-6-phosphate aminotransferase (isomerizing)